MSVKTVEKNMMVLMDPEDFVQNLVDVLILLSK